MSSGNTLAWLQVDWQNLSSQANALKKRAYKLIGKRGQE